MTEEFCSIVLGSNIIGMTLLILFFLSGVLIQGLKIVFTQAANQVKDYLEKNDEGAVALSSGKINRINPDVHVFNERRSVKNYAFSRYRV